MRSARVAAKVKASRSTRKRRGDRFVALRSYHLGAMDLRDRGRRDGWTERCECFGDGLAESGHDNSFGLGLRKRRHLVLQRFQVAGERGTDHVGPRRQELAELDVGGAELGQRGGKPVLGAVARWPLDYAGELQSGLRR